MNGFARLRRASVVLDCRSLASESFRRRALGSTVLGQRSFGSAPSVIVMPRARHSSSARSTLGRCPFRRARNAFPGRRASLAASSSVKSCRSSSALMRRFSRSVVVRFAVRFFGIGSLSPVVRGRHADDRRGRPVRRLGRRRAVDAGGSGDESGSGRPGPPMRLHRRVTVSRPPRDGGRELGNAVPAATFFRPARRATRVSQVCPVMIARRSLSRDGMSFVCRDLPSGRLLFLVAIRSRLACRGTFLLDSGAMQGCRERQANLCGSGLLFW